MDPLVTLLDILESEETTLSKWEIPGLLEQFQESVEGVVTLPWIPSVLEQKINEAYHTSKSIVAYMKQCVAVHAANPPTPRRSFIRRGEDGSIYKEDVYSNIYIETSKVIADDYNNSNMLEVSNSYFKEGVDEDKEEELNNTGIIMLLENSLEQNLMEFSEYDQSYQFNEYTPKLNDTESSSLSLNHITRTSPLQKNMKRISSQATVVGASSEYDQNESRDIPNDFNEGESNVFYCQVYIINCEINNNQLANTVTITHFKKNPINSVTAK